MRSKSRSPYFKIPMKCSNITDSSGSAKLVALLMDESRTNKQLADLVYLSVLFGLREDEFPACVDAVFFCITNGNIKEDRKTTLVSAVAQLPEFFEDVAETVLTFMTKAYFVEPATVYMSLTTWAGKLLQCDDSESEDATLKWLETHLFRRFRLTVINDHELALEYSKTMAIKGLAGMLMHMLEIGRQSGADYDDFERVMEALRACGDWLTDFVEAIKARTEKRNSPGCTFDDSSEASSTELAETTEKFAEAADDAKALLEVYSTVSFLISDWSDCNVYDTNLRARDRRGGSVRSSMDDLDTSLEGSGDEDWTSDTGDADGS